jgi:hypothetical protein
MDADEIFDIIKEFVRDRYTPCLVHPSFLRDFCDDDRCKGGTFKLKGVSANYPVPHFDWHMTVAPDMYRILKEWENDENG